MQRLKNIVENTRLSFLEKLESFVAEKFQDGEISKDDYYKILESINNPEFSRFLFLYLSVEGTELLIESIAQAIIIYKHGYGGIDYLEAVGKFVLLHASAKLFYTYAFSKVVDFREPILFSFFNTLPLGNFYTPTRWLKWDDKEALKNSVSMVKDSVFNTITHNKITYSHGFQSLTRLF